MTKLLLTIALVLLIIGCSSKDITEDLQVPDDLKDCKFYRVEGFNGTGNLKVVRCPNSNISTTYRSGKANETTMVIDGDK